MEGWAVLGGGRASPKLCAAESDPCSLDEQLINLPCLKIKEVRSAYTTPTPRKSPPTLPLYQVNLAEAEEKAGDKLSGWRLRVALAEGAAAVMRTDPKLMSPEVLEAALSCISGLLADDSYAARLAGGRLVQVRGLGWGIFRSAVAANSSVHLRCLHQSPHRLAPTLVWLMPAGHITPL